ncbi:alpha/beta hydrolase [Actinoalloteichus sp. AHMU CJ021]|uniref:alpha/beta fold hydrolase n=1 Tax=Actinoalloteichus sp. AHMU CJ021 TaxID=2072503 RepID=UPI000CA06CD9|nr:alpha/beta hydrolase [Actinoalloteichus sp. AHMU CJ021]
MRPWQVVGMVGGVIGAALGGAVVGAAAQSARFAALRERGELAELGVSPADREYTVAADDGLPLAVEEIDPVGGGAEVTVVLVHGYVVDRRCWHFQRRDLPESESPRVRLVLYDQRSHGRSGRGRRDSATIEQLGRDLAAVLRVAAPTGPVVLVGHSMGGMTVMALAEQQPELFGELVRGVALVGTAAGDVGKSGLPRTLLSRRNPVTRGLGRFADWQPELLEAARRAGNHLTWGATRAVAFGDKSVDPALVNLMYDMIQATPMRVFADFVDTFTTHDRVAALGGLAHCETLVLAGDADRVTPFSHSEIIAAELPDAEFVSVAGAGHMVMLERSDLTTEALRGLIRRVVENRESHRGRQRSGR